MSDTAIDDLLTYSVSRLKSRRYDRSFVGENDLRISHSVKAQSRNDEWQSFQPQEHFA